MATVQNLNKWVVQAFGEQLLQLCSLQAENEALRAELKQLEEKKACPQES